MDQPAPGAAEIPHRRPRIDWIRGQAEAASERISEPAYIISWNGSDDRLGWRAQGDGRWFVTRAGITTLASTSSVPSRATREPLPA